MPTQRQTSSAQAPRSPWPLPDGWQWRHIRQVIQGTRNRPARELGQRVSYIEISHIDSTKGVIADADTIFLGSATAKERRTLQRAKLIEENDVLFGKVRPQLRNVALVSSQYHNQVCSKAFHVLRPDREIIEPEWLFYLCRSPLVIDSLQPLVRGSISPHVSHKDIEGVDIPLPPVTTQFRIIARLKATLGDVEEARAVLSDMHKDIGTMEQAILERAFHGRL